MKTYLLITLFYLIGGFAHAATSSQEAQDDVVKIATTGEKPPFNFCGTKESPVACTSPDQLKGLDVDMAKAVCEMNDLKCEFVINDWPTMFKNLGENQYDAVFSTVGFKPERLNYGQFTLPYIPTDIDPKSAHYFFMVKLANKDKYTYTNDGLKDIPVGAVEGTLQKTVLTQQFSKSKIVLFNSRDEMLEGLVKGDVELILDGINPLQAFFKKHPEFGPGHDDDGFAPKFSGYGIINPTLVRAIVSNKTKHSGLLEMINEAIFNLQMSGFVEENHKTWVGK